MKPLRLNKSELTVHTTTDWSVLNKMVDRLCPALFSQTVGDGLTAEIENYFPLGTVLTITTRGHSGLRRNISARRQLLIILENIILPLTAKFENTERLQLCHAELGTRALSIHFVGVGSNRSLEDRRAGAIAVLCLNFAIKAALKGIDQTFAGSQSLDYEGSTN